jgi:hypothetical protein
LLGSGLEFFHRLREQPLRKRPSTAELVNWVTILLAFGAATDQGLATQQKVFTASLSSLVKTQEDLAEVHRFSTEHFRPHGGTNA